MPSLSLHPAPLLLTSALLLACPGEGQGDPSTGSETTAPTTSPTTSTSEPTTSEPTTSEPTTSTTADTSAMTGTTADTSTTSDPSTTAASTGQTSTTTDPSTTGTTDTSTTGTTDTSTTDTTGGATGLVLDPASLVFFELPIGSIRHAVAGFDPDQQTCVSIIFFGDIENQICDDFQVGDSNGFPYVFIVPGAAPPCMDWDYAGNVTLDAASGCVQLTAFDPLTIAIDMALTVTGAPFTGTITVASP